MTNRIALVVAGVLAGCGHGSINTLVRVDQEPPGANCPDGGVAINTGRDDNRNGLVDDDEITETTYVCGGAKKLTCEDRHAVTGIISISSAADLAQLDGIGCIDGELLIAGYPEADLPELSLEVVTGGITIAGNPELVSLAGLGRISDVGSIYAVQGNDALVDIGALGHVNVTSVIISGNDSLPDLSGLESWIDIRHNFILSNNAGLTSLHGLEGLSSSTDGIYIKGNRGLTSLSALDHLRNAALIEISGNAALTSVQLASLQKVSVTLVINANDRLAMVALPALATTSGVQMINNPMLSSVSLPSLIVTALFQFQFNSALSSLRAPSFSASTGLVDLTQLPALKTLDLGALSTIGGGLTLNGLAMLGNLSGLASLGSVSGDVAVNGCNTLTNLTGLSKLDSIGGSLTIAGNAKLSSFSGAQGTLKSVGANLTITQNPMLPLATAQAFANSLTVGGTKTIN